MSAPTGLLIPVAGPLQEVTLDGGLAQLQALVGGGYVEAIPMTPAVGPEAAEHSTVYVNEEGNFRPDLAPNMRATDFMVPGIGVNWGTVVRGPMLLAGFDPRVGEHAGLPEREVRRARLVESEAGS